MADKFFFTETYGLVMCGGQSSRMDTDKSMLQYYSKPQRYYVYDMLLPCCEKVLISCNAVQVNNIEAGYDFIKDDEAFANIGPMAALLTAFTQFPHKNVLLIGCDYPFLKVDELQLFSSHCKDEPIAFYNENNDVYDPMLAWYPFSFFDKLKIMYDAKQFSLQHFLKNNHAIKHLPFDVKSFKSVDTAETFAQAIKIING